MAIQRSIDALPSEQIQWQRVCVASIIGHCEAIAKAGLLPEPSEESLRILIAETLCAFGMTHNNNQELA